MSTQEPIEGTVLLISLGEGKTSVPYYCPPGHGLDFLGLQWLVRVFGPATRDRFPSNRKLKTGDFDQPVLAALDEVLELNRDMCEHHPQVLYALDIARAIPPGWPSPESIDLLRRTMIRWWHTFLGEALDEPTKTPRHRIFTQTISLLRREGFAPYVNQDEVAKDLAKHAMKVAPRPWAQQANDHAFTGEVVQFGFQYDPDDMGLWELPPDSGQVRVRLPRLERRLRDIFHPAEPKAPKELPLEIEPGARDRLDEDRDFRDAIDELRSDLVLCAALDRLSGSTYGAVTRQYGMSTDQIRWAETKVRERLSRFAPTGTD